MAKKNLTKEFGAASALPRRETDKAAIAAARKIINRTVLGSEGEELEDMPESLRLASTDLAYANQFLFAIVCPAKDMKVYEIYITPKKVFKQDSTFHDDSIVTQDGRALIPMENDDPAGRNVYVCNTATAPQPVEAARQMLKAGFFWDAGYQQVCNEYEGGEHQAGVNHLNVKDIAALISAPKKTTKKTNPKGP